MSLVRKQLTRSEAEIESKNLAVVLISTHGGIGLRHSVYRVPDISTLSAAQSRQTRASAAAAVRAATEDIRVSCPLSKANTLEFIDTFDVPKTRDESDVTIYKLTATSPGICNLVDETYTTLLTQFIKSRSNDLSVLQNPENFVRQIRDFYAPMHEDVLMLETKEAEEALTKEERRRRQLIGIKPSQPFERSIWGHSSRNLNIQRYISGDTMPNKLFCRTDSEIEGVGEGKNDFTIKVLNVNDEDIFDEITFDISPGVDGNVYSTMMSILVDYLVTTLGRKNIIIVDLTCSSFDISSADKPLISERTQRRVARELYEKKLFGGKYRRTHKRKKQNRSSNSKRRRRHVNKTRGKK
jgi:hypothetical protein